jgi:lipopolysaccharide transport protein LptA
MAAAAAWAAEPQATTSNTVITATKLTFDYRNHHAVLEGNVVVRDPSVRIEADRMTIVFEADNTAKIVTAMGNVRIDQADKKATCQRAVYQVKLGRLDLSGNPVVRRNQDVLRSKKTITFWRDEDRMEGDEIELTVYPSRGGTFDGILKE